jgi:hypothetical protein
MKYFTIKELTSSSTAKRKGISNSPDKRTEASLVALIYNILDPLREKYGKPIVVSSGYRCPTLNRLVGGAPTSQHIRGEASDIHTVSNTPEDNKKLFDLIVELKLPFDQLIDEYNYKWVHVSYSGRNRRQVLHIK